MVFTYRPGHWINIKHSLLLFCCVDAIKDNLFPPLRPRHNRIYRKGYHHAAQFQMTLFFLYCCNLYVMRLPFVLGYLF